MKTRSSLLPVLLFLGSFTLAPVRAAESASIRVGNSQLAVVLGARPTPPEVRVKELLAERLLDRSGIALAPDPGTAGIRIVAGTVASNDKIKAFAASREDLAALGADGYAIEVNAANNEIHILGQSDSGVVAGVGRLMREMRYHPGKVEVEVFKALAPIDIFNIFPCDAGGCSCADCTPWPTRGLWKIAKPLGARIHAISPQTEIWVDTWHLNHPTFGGKDWENLVADLDASKQAPA